MTMVYTAKEIKQVYGFDFYITGRNLEKGTKFKVDENYRGHETDNYNSRNYWTTLQSACRRLNYLDMKYDGGEQNILIVEDTVNLLKHDQDWAFILRYSNVDHIRTSPDIVQSLQKFEAFFEAQPGGWEAFVKKESSLLQRYKQIKAQCVELGIETGSVLKKGMFKEYKFNLNAPEFVPTNGGTKVNRLVC